jgi:NAD(P)-dependent dehydrogenase (short-subunit alcohol dehydrogenase family)
MAKIILLGSSSELGNHLANEFMNRHKDLYGKILYVGRNSELSDIHWKPDELDLVKIQSLVDELDIEKNDLIIFAFAKFIPGMLSDNEVKPGVGEINETLMVSGVVPTLLFLEIFNKLCMLKSGRIVVYSSIAAKPVLNSNLFYGASKNLLDQIVEGHFKVAANNSVLVSLVRPGFVATHLNRNRKKTALSTTKSKVTRKITKSHKSEVIWVPQTLKYLSYLLQMFNFLRAIANKKIQDSF